jgi:hypothetical protein
MVARSDRLVKNGSAAGKPKKLRQPYGDQFTRTAPRGKLLAMKVPAVLFVSEWHLDAPHHVPRAGLLD